MWPKIKLYCGCLILAGAEHPIKKAFFESEGMSAGVSSLKTNKQAPNWAIALVLYYIC